MLRKELGNSQFDVSSSLQCIMNTTLPVNSKVVQLLDQRYLLPMVRAHNSNKV